MAFLNKLGSLTRHSLSQNANVSMSNMLASVRYMSTSKLFVGGLSFGTDDSTLKEAFSSFGEVTEARVITDRDTGRSRGFGFVNFDNEESAKSALSAMDGQDINGRTVRISYATDNRTSSSRYGGGGGGGNGGGGGYGGDGGGGRY